MLANAQPSSSLAMPTLPRLLCPDATRFVGIDIGVDRADVASIGTCDDRATFALQPDSPLVWMSRSRFELNIDPFQPPAPNLVDTVCRTLRDRLPRCVDGERHIAAIALPLPWIHYETTRSAEVAASRANCDEMFSASIFQSPAHLCQWPVSAGKDLQVIAATAETAACQVAEAVASVGYRVQSIIPHGVALIHSAEALTNVDTCAVVLLQRYGGLVAANQANQCSLCRPLPACDDTHHVPSHADELEPWLESVAAEVTATLRYAARLEVRCQPGAPVLLCGSAALIPGVDEALATMISRPVATWRYTKQTRPTGADDPSDDVTHHDPSRAVAVSLAHCAAVRHAAGGR